MKESSLTFIALSALILISTLFSSISMAESISSAPMANVGSLSTAVISAVQSGSTNISTLTLSSSPDPIGKNITIDIRIDNVSIGFWGWSLPTVTWDTAVMNLTKVQQGSFLSDNSGGDPTTFVGNSKNLWFNFVNIIGTISGGLSEGINEQDTSIDSSGVLATLTFLLAGSGNTTINIAGGNLRASRSDTTGVNVTCNSILVNVLSDSPAPTPTASPSPTPSPTPIPVQTQTPIPTTTSNPTPTPSPTSNTNSPTPTATTSIPEFPLWSFVLLMLLGSTVAVLAIFCRKKWVEPGRSLIYIVYFQ